MKKYVIAGVETVINQCANLSPKDDVLIITDDYKSDILDVIINAILERDIEPVVVKMQQRKYPGEEPPNIVSKAMREASLIIMICYTTIGHSAATFNALKNKARILVLNRFTKSMLGRKSLRADFQAIAPLCKKLAKMFTEGNTIEIISDFNKKLSASISGRKGNALTGIPENGQMCPLPNIEANIAPIEDSVNGEIVINGSIPILKINNFDEPVIIKFKDGKIISIKGGEKSKILKENIDRLNDPLCWNIAEIGIGLNPYCEFIGVPNEDEGKAGTAHIAVGNNIILGGINNAKSHYDLIFQKASIMLDGKTIMKKGVLNQ